MLNGFFAVLVFLSVASAALTGRMEATSSGALEAAKKAVELALGLVGAMTLFMGLMKIAQDGGLLRIVARAAAPVMRRLFPEVPRDHPAMSAMILNIAANLLGLGNAATPFGIRAMQELDRLNPVRGTATNAMVLFLAINTAGLAILPTTVIALRTASGSEDPAGILFTTWFASGCATATAIAAATLLSRLRRYRVTPGGAQTDRPTGPDGVEDLPAIDALPGGPVPRWRAWVATAYVVVIGAALVAHLMRESDAGALEAARSVFSYWTIPLLIAGLVLFGWARGVPVYESFVEGAKDGFHVAVRMIPYLVAILVAVGMFRASGGLAGFVAALSPLTVPLGVPAEVLPLAVLRPLSGSGALGVMSEILTARGPDSYVGYLASTMQGSTDTTFYVLAVYFGAVGIKKTRHAVPAGLLADVAGLSAAAFIVRIVFG